MRLNDSFLVSKWENGFSLKHIFLDHQLDVEAMKRGGVVLTPEEWKLRQWHAHLMVDSPRDQKIYYITPNAQKEANAISHNKKIDTKWFTQIENMTGIYVTSKETFYKFIKRDDGIAVLFFYLFGERKEPRYMSIQIPLDGSEINLFHWQDPTIIDNFFRLLLFVELGETQTVVVPPHKKVKYGKGGDDKLFNEAGLLNVQLVTPNYNKIIIVDGGIVVSSHWRVQPYDSRANPKYRLKQIPEYAKTGIIKRKK